MVLICFFYKKLLDSGNSALNDEVSAIAQNLSMHAAAMKPGFTNISDVPQDYIN